MPEFISNFEPIKLAGILVGVFALYLARGPYSIWLLRLPGTLAHELAHYLIALVTGSRPTPISLRLKRSEHGWTLGAVEFQPGMLTAGLVALAPLYLLPALVVGLQAASGEAGALQQAVTGYVTVMLCFGAVPSRADWQIALRYPVGMLFTFALIAFALGVHLPAKG